MPKLQATLLEVDNGNGTSSPVAGVSVKIFRVSTLADVGTVTTDSNGYTPETVVAGSAGDPFRLRVENYQGRAGWLEVTSVP